MFSKSLNNIMNSKLYTANNIALLARSLDEQQSTFGPGPLPTKTASTLLKQHKSPKPNKN